jgi:CxxC motif-containing protein (DUF1111 family)
MRGVIHFGVISVLVAFTGQAFAIDLQPKAGAPLAGLTAAQLNRFTIGRTRFTSQVTVAGGGGPIFGLGPVFNETSCGTCHDSPTGGAGDKTVTRFGFLDDKTGTFDPLADKGGSLLQAQAIDPSCLEHVDAGANVTTLRVTNSALGDGLVEAIPEGDLLAHESAGPGISGRAHMVNAFEDQVPTLHVGRFGWKAQLATVLSFSADASFNELGLTNRFLQSETDPNGIDPPGLTAPCDDGVADPDDIQDNEGVFFIDRVTDFQRFLSAPPQTPKNGMSGETIFNTIGCNACHVQSFTTSNEPEFEDAIRNKTIHPYSDFLLHDMGTLGDNIVQGDASGREFRTPPLWNLRVRDPMIHDGRAAAGTFTTRVTTAINAHNAFGSEAQPSAVAYAALPTISKNNVIAFLNSLGRAEFDANGDDTIDGVDLGSFVSCFTGPTPTYTPDDPCSVHDIDQDGDVDNDDFNLFLQAYEPAQGDCNGNSINDLRDILDHTSLDCNTNGTPDECDPEYNDITLFVNLLTGQVIDPLITCMFDRNHDTLLDGRDIQPFINDLLP